MILLIAVCSHEKGNESKKIYITNVSPLLIEQEQAITNSMGYRFVKLTFDFGPLTFCYQATNEIDCISEITSSNDQPFPSVANLF